MFQTRVQTLRVLTHNDEIEFRITTRHIRQRPHRPQVRVKSSALRNPTLTEVKPLPTGVGDRPLECDFVANNRIEQVLRQRLAKFFEVRLRAGVMGFPLNLNAGSFNDSTTLEATSGPMPSPGISVIGCRSALG